MTDLDRFIEHVREHVAQAGSMTIRNNFIVDAGFSPSLVRWRLGRAGLETAVSLADLAVTVRRKGDG